MELMATSIDGFLAYWCGLSDVHGQIHSVFQRALNIETSGGQLISVLSMAGLDGPNTVVTELPRGLGFISMGLRSGMPVRLDRMEADLGHGALCLQISTAQKWWPRLASGEERLDMARLKRNLSALLRALPQEEFTEGLAGLVFLVGKMVAGRWRTIERQRHSRLARQALPGIRNLLQGALERDGILLKKALGKLVGLGVGMTPSGDDLLLGFVGTLSNVSRRVGGPEVGDLLEIVKHHLAAMKDRTTFVSGNLMSYACAGRVSSPILSVIRTLLYGKTSAASCATGRLLEQGASSGAEILLGILLALTLVPRLRES